MTAQDVPDGNPWTAPGEGVQLPPNPDPGRSQRILRRLALLGPGPPAFYADALSLISSPGYTLLATFHFVSHALREVESAVREVLLPRDFVKPTKGQNHPAEIRAICNWLDIPEGSSTTTNWLRLAEQSAPNAHRRALALPVGDISQAHALVDRWGDVLDPLLERYEAKYVAAVPLLRALAAKSAPSQKDLHELRNQVPNNLDALSIFFDSLTSPNWLAPLAEAGYYEDPPAPDIDPEAGTVRFPPWPQGEYLIRVCESDLATTESILSNARARQNFRVAATLFSCVLKLTPEHAAALLPRMREWLDVPFLGTVRETAVAAVEHLIGGDQEEAALDLAKVLLDANLGILEGVGDDES